MNLDFLTDLLQMLGLLHFPLLFCWTSSSDSSQNSYSYNTVDQTNRQTRTMPEWSIPTWIPTWNEYVGVANKQQRIPFETQQQKQAYSKVGNIASGEDLDPYTNQSLSKYTGALANQYQRNFGDTLAQIGNQYNLAGINPTSSDRYAVSAGQAAGDSAAKYGTELASQYFNQYNTDYKNMLNSLNWLLNDTASADTMASLINFMAGSDTRTSGYSTGAGNVYNNTSSSPNALTLLGSLASGTGNLLTGVAAL